MDALGAAITLNEGNHAREDARSAVGNGKAEGVSRAGSGTGTNRMLVPDEYFTVDGTLLEAWASLKNFQHW